MELRRSEAPPQSKHPYPCYQSAFNRPRLDADQLELRIHYLRLLIRPFPHPFHIHTVLNHA